MICSQHEIYLIIVMIIVIIVNDYDRIVKHKRDIYHDIWAMGLFLLGIWRVWCSLLSLLMLSVEFALSDHGFFCSKMPASVSSHSGSDNGPKCQRTEPVAFFQSCSVPEMVNIQKTMERSTMFNGKIHYKSTGPCENHSQTVFTFTRG